MMEQIKKNIVSYARQQISDEDVQAVTKCLRSDWLTQGPCVEQFERAVADYCGVGHAVAVSSATAGLHLACRALGLCSGGILWTSPNTFVASANCAKYCGADVDFVDIDPHSYNLSVEQLRQKLVVAQKQGCLPSVVVPVHFAGQSCAMMEIHALAEEFGFAILEDAAHAAGADYLGRKVGCCEFSDAAVFSWHAVKNITTGEGGMILTNNRDLAERSRLLRSHGITRDHSLMEKPDEGPWYYEQIELGVHYRITDFQCALGISQLARLDEFVSRRREIVSCYSMAFSGLPLILPWENPHANSSWHLYVVQVDERRTGRTRRQLFDALRTAGIGANVHYIPVHIQPYYARLGFRLGDFPVAEAYYSRCITLPLFPGMRSEDIEHVTSTVQHFFT